MNSKTRETFAVCVGTISAMRLCGAWGGCKASTTDCPQFLLHLTHLGGSLLAIPDQGNLGQAIAEVQAARQFAKGRLGQSLAPKLDRQRQGLGPGFQGASLTARQGYGGISHEMPKNRTGRGRSTLVGHILDLGLFLEAVQESVEHGVPEALVQKVANFIAHFLE